MLIFLDIDGVMVSARGWSRPDLLDDGFIAFSSNAVNTLQTIVSDEATIMLTTSHKHRFSIDEWKAIFKRRGINVSKLDRLDENKQNLSRKDEVLNWFNSNSHEEDFIIIDDDKSLNGLPEFLKNNLVLTSSLIGLTNSHLEEINSILNERHLIEA